MRQNLFTKFLIIIACALIILPTFVSAADILRSGLDTAAKTGGLKAESASVPTLSQTVGKVIGIVLPFLSIIFLILTLYGGITWMTAGGDKGNRKKAKDIIVSAAIGLIVTLLAYQITSFVLKNIQISGSPQL